MKRENIPGDKVRERSFRQDAHVEYLFWHSYKQLNTVTLGFIWAHSRCTPTQIGLKIYPHSLDEVSCERDRINCRNHRIIAAYDRTTALSIIIHCSTPTQALGRCINVGNCTYNYKYNSPITARSKVRIWLVCHWITTAKSGNVYACGRAVQTSKRQSHFALTESSSSSSGSRPHSLLGRAGLLMIDVNYHCYHCCYHPVLQLLSCPGRLSHYETFVRETECNCAETNPNQG